MDTVIIARMAPWFAAVALVATALAGGAQAQGPGPSTLAVHGNVERQLTVSIDDLKQLPVQRIEDVRVVRPTGSASTVPEVTRSYTGCLLRDVLERAKPVERSRLDLRKSALVVYERDGATLPNDEGPLALVSLKDTRPGPRHVKWLQSIELRELDP